MMMMMTMMAMTMIIMTIVAGKQYRVAVYGCNRGFMLSGRTSDSMFCQEYGWTGLEPECERTETSDSEPEESDLCLTDGLPVCYCSPGFEILYR